MSFDVLCKRTETFANICRILEIHQYKRTNLIPILKMVQEECGYLPEDVLRFIASSLQMPTSSVYGVATFYAHFTLTPRGKYVIRVCDGTACHVRGSSQIVDKLRQLLTLGIGEKTTSDGLFTVETVSCFGACGSAPVVALNDRFYSLMSPEKIEELIKNTSFSERSK